MLSTHRVLISVKPALGCCTYGLRLRHLLDPGTKGVGRLDRASERSREGPPPDGEVQTGDVGVEPCPTTRHTPPGIGDGRGDASVVRLHDDAQQSRPAIPSATPDAGPHRTRDGWVGLESSPVDPHQSSPCAV